MAGDPAVAFVVGWLLLSQCIKVWDVVGLGCVVVAGAGVMYHSAVGESETGSVGLKECQRPEPLPFALLAVR